MRKLYYYNSFCINNFGYPKFKKMSKNIFYLIVHILFYFGGNFANKSSLENLLINNNKVKMFFSFFTF